LTRLSRYILRNPKKICLLNFIQYIYLHGKNNFVKISKNVAKYRSKNNFAELLKLCRALNR